MFLAQITNSYPSQEKAIFENLEYSSAKESDGPAKEWISSQKLGDFISNKMSPGSEEAVKISNISTGVTIAEISTSKSSVSEAVKSAREAREGWSKMQGHIRARHLYR